MSTQTSLSVVGSQPLRHPFSVSALESGACFQDFEDLLENDLKSTPGFEILAHMNVFEIKKRRRKGGELDLFLTSSHYDIVGEGRQSLFLAVKETEFHCFFPASIRVSALTDAYSDPVFIVNILRTGSKCFEVRTSGGTPVGFMDKINNYFSLTNEIENTRLQLTRNWTCFEVTENGESVGIISLDDSGLYRIETVDSLSASSKVLLLGFSFYLTTV